VIPSSRLVRRTIQALCLAVFVLLFIRAWPYGGPIARHRLSRLASPVPLDAFLSLDPLVGISAAIAARRWNPALVGAALTLALCVIVPRAFCSHVCPLGTLIDAMDWLAARLPRRLRPRRTIALGRVRWYVLAGVLAAAAAGVMLAGHLAAIPLLTRGLVFSAGWAQLALLKSPGMVPPFHGWVAVSVALLAGVLLLALAAPRFWCRCLCPSGALISLASTLSPVRRRVLDSCTGCGRCVTACPFGAIGSDFRNRDLACATCRTCAAVCPADAVRFEPCWRPAAGREASPEQCSAEPGVSRRNLLIAAGASGAAAAIIVKPPFAAAPVPLLRPPGSVPESLFLRLCVRCGECIRVCPGSVLHPAGLAAGIDALWTPVVVPSHAGCHQDCNFCTQVCPTGAITPLTVDQKRKTRLGLAAIDKGICLPHSGRSDCRLCYQECEAAGYHAIEMRTITLQVGEIPPGAVSPEEIESMSRIEAPHIVSEKCVGCGLCEYRCHSALVRRRGILPRSAVVVMPPPGR